LWREGKLREAKEHIGLAVKGFASLYMPQLLLTNLANLAQLELRTGDYAAAQTIHMQLSAEYKQSGQLAAETRGAIAYCLAISDKSRSSQPADEVNVRECLTQQIKLYTEAIQAYEQLGQWEEACSIMIELACVAGE